MASVRAAESNKQTLHRQQQNKEPMASVRAAESRKQTLHRQQHDREYRAARRANDVSIEQAIELFYSDIKNGLCLHMLSPFHVQKECCFMNISSVPMTC